MTTTATLPDRYRPTPALLRVFGDFRFHGDGDLLALAFLPDGALASVEEPGVLRVWDPETGRQVGWHFLSDLETQWAISGDGRVIASASDDLSLWDASSGLLLTALPQPAWVTALAFRNDPAFVATGHDDGAVRIWDAAGHKMLNEWPTGDWPVSALAFSPDGRRLAAASEDKNIYLWDAESGMALGLLTGHTDRVHALAWHPSGRKLVSAGWDTTARVWDAETFQPVILLNNHATQVTALAFSPDGKRLASADSGDAIHVWDFDAGKELAVLKGHTDLVYSLAFSKDGQHLASGGAEKVIRIWDLRKGQSTALADMARLPNLGNLRRGWSGLAVSPDGSRLATAGGGVLQVWDAASGQPQAQAQTDATLQSLAFSPDGRWVAGGGSDARVQLWETATGRVGCVLVDDDQKDAVTALAFSPDAGQIACGSAEGMAVWLWDLASGEPSLLIPDAVDGCTVEALAFHPAGNLLAAGGIDWLATGGSDGAIAVWDLTQRCEIALLDGGTTCLAFHPSGKTLAAGSVANAVCVWDLDTKEMAAELTGHDDAVTCVAYSPDGRWLASGSDDRTVRLWDAATLRPAATADLDTQVKALAFAPDGKVLYTGNGNTTCYQLDVQRLLSGG